MSEVTDVQDLEQFIAEYKKNKQDDEAADIRYMSVAEYAEQTQRSPVTVRVMCQLKGRSNSESYGAFL